MSSKKDNLPLSLETDGDSSGTITYANDVVAIIAGVAASEVEGIAGMCSGGGISDVFGRNKNITKGVKVEIGTEEASVDLYVIVEYGTPIQTAALDVQENVRKAIETMTGLHVVRVDVHVQGVSFEKENEEVKAGLENAALAEGEHKAADQPAPAVEEPDEPSDEEQNAQPSADDAQPEEQADAETAETASSENE